MKTSASVPYMNPVSVEEALEILSDPLEIFSFTMNYPYFAEMEKEPLHHFINERFASDISADERWQLIDLCKVLDFFDQGIYAIVKNELRARKELTIKLACLDYLNNFYILEEQVREEYASLNLELNKKTSNHLVKFQTNINLMLCDFRKYKAKVFRTLETEGLRPTYYYRFINTLYDDQFRKLGLIPSFEELVNKTQLNDKQKHDLLRLANEASD